MIDLFVWWTSHTCELRGSTFRKHCCQRCRAVYGYQMTRAVRVLESNLFGVGAAKAPEKAEAKAEAELEYELAKGFDPVPCPGCGWYQPRMVHALRDKACRPLAMAWNGCFCAGVVFLMFAIGIPNERRSQGKVPDQFDKDVVAFSIACAAVALVLSPIFFALHRSRVRRSDPNGSPAGERIARAIERGARIVKPPRGPRVPWERGRS
jgi:hypothetical protein